MKAILDTNVVVSGIFFGGVPRQVLDAWADGRYELILSPGVIDEYLRTCDRLAASYPSLSHESALTTLIGHATLVTDPRPRGPVTADADDDKFMLCARESSAVVVSGDRHLLDASGWEGVRVLTPREFLAVLEQSDRD